MNRRTELALTIVLAATAIIATAACIWPDSLFGKLVLGLGGIIAFLLVGSAKANPRRDNALEKEASAAEQSARDKVLSTDPRAVLSGLGPDTRTRIDRAKAMGIAACLDAARKTLHRGRGAGGGGSRG